MATGTRTGENPGSEEESTLVQVPPSDAGNEQRRQPAKLPTYSQAAVSQRLADVPEQPTRGVMYEASQTRQHEPGWYTKRHFKRRNLRVSNLKVAVTTRTSTRTMISMSVSIVSILLVVAIVFVTIQSFTNAVNKKYQGSIMTLQDLLPKDNIKIYDSQGTDIFQSADQGLQTSLPLNKISPNIIHAEVAIEDQSFWKNPGYDITGIVRAAIEDVTAHGVVSGGSTITQQLIKNTLVGNQDTAIRKLQEILLAPEITRYYTKEQIMDMYLNTTYYGDMVYGTEAAATRYFGLQDTSKETAAQQIDVAQAATLAGIPSNPAFRNPIGYPHNNYVRTLQVLQQLYVQGYINGKQKAEAILEI